MTERNCILVTADDKTTTLTYDDIKGLREVFLKEEDFKEEFDEICKSWDAARLLKLICLPDTITPMFGFDRLCFLQETYKEIDNDVLQTRYYSVPISNDRFIRHIIKDLVKNGNYEIEVDNSIYFIGVAEINYINDHNLGICLGNDIVGESKFTQTSEHDICEMFKKEEAEEKNKPPEDFSKKLHVATQASLFDFGLKV